MTSSSVEVVSYKLYMQSIRFEAVSYKPYLSSSSFDAVLQDVQIYYFSNICEQLQFTSSFFVNAHLPEQLCSNVY